MSDVTSREALERETSVQFYSSPGPGGQRKNKSLSAVRLRHSPTGIVVIATEERSQRRNLARAFERLADRLEKRSRPVKPRHATKPTQGSKRRRLDAKGRRSTVKATRGRVRDE